MSHPQRSILAGAPRPGGGGRSRRRTRGAGCEITDPPRSVMIVNPDSNDIAFHGHQEPQDDRQCLSSGTTFNPHMVMMSPDGRYVVTGGTRANKAFIIDTRTLQLVKVIQTDIAPEHLAFSRTALVLSGQS